MALYSVAGRTSAVPTTLRGPSLYATTGVRPAIREVGVFNTTVTACGVALVRATSTGTQGAGLTEIAETDLVHTPVATAFNTHTADCAVTAPFRQASLGAAIGSGVIWTFGEGGSKIDALTTAGLVIVSVGTGQHLDFWITWDE